MNKGLEAYYKLDHTCCLNSSKIEYGIITDDEDRDCKNIDEMADCLDTIETELNEINEIFKNHNIKSFADLNERLCDYNELKFDDDIRQQKRRAKL